MKNALTRLTIIVMLLVMVTGQVASALSDAQAQLFQEHINYFDASTCGAATATASTGSDTLVGGSVPEQLFNFFVSNGFTPFQAAGILGNIAHEGVFDPTNIEDPAGQTKDPAVIASLTGQTQGYGLVGWTPGNSLLSILNQLKITDPPYTVLAQAKAILGELDGKVPSLDPAQVGNDIRNAKTIEDATAAFQGNQNVGGPYLGFERPADESGTLGERIDSAKGFLQKFGNGVVGPSVDAGGGLQSTVAIDVGPIAQKYNLQSAIVKKIGESAAAGSYKADQPPQTPASVAQLVVASVFLSERPNLSKTVTVTASEASGATSAPAARTSISLHDALQQMLMKSSDNAANVLIDAAGGLNTVNSKAHALGYKSTTIGSYYGNSPDKNQSTVTDLTQAMEDVYSGGGANYKVAQDALQNDEVTWGLQSEANKWGGTSDVTGNSAVFDVNGDKYIITMFDNQNGAQGPNTPGAAPIVNATNDIVSQLNKTAATANPVTPAQNCCPTGGGSTVDGSAGSATTDGTNSAGNEYSFLIGKGLKPIIAAAITGNNIWESGGSQTQLTLVPTSVNSIGATGIAQWYSGRATALHAYAQAHGKPWDDLGLQLDYLWHEFQTTEAGPLHDTEAQTTIESATTTFEKTFEVSGDTSSYPTRISLAKAVLQKFGGGAAATTTGSAPDSGGSCGSNSGSTDISGYQNPLRDVKSLRPERIDQGVDYGGEGKVYALGPGTITDLINSGWNYGGYDAFIVEKLNGGPANGRYVYVAEACVPVSGLHVGQTITDSTTVICNMINPLDSGIETGWADPASDGVALAQSNGGYTEGMATKMGENYNQLLVKLGAPSGTQQPQMGSLPAGWPTW